MIAKLTFHRIRLASVSLAGAMRNGTSRTLRIGNRTLVFAEVRLDRARTSRDPDLVGMIEDWTLNSNRRDLLPAVAEFDGALFAGFIDTSTDTLTLQREHTRDVDRAIGYALCAAWLRTVSDRTRNHLPTRVLPFPEDLGHLLDAAVAAPEEILQTPDHEAVSA